MNLIKLGWVEPSPVKVFGAQATGCSPDFPCREGQSEGNRAAEAKDDRAFAGDRQSRRRAPMR